ncbi:VOC family protein [Roseivirga sp. 4D4]|uniref:VOC family protein n=1 Tax=Roseivirga sp. 4D4 TaxID=1889784 RepID=UPI0009F22629|nr:VOC family protein [Roseivirga sp. 4D4]
MKTKALSLLSALLILSACSTKEEFDRELGVVSAFSELVNAGVKQLALSSPMTPTEMDKLYPLAVEAAKVHNVLVTRESDLIKTSLFPKDIVEGKEVLLLHQGNTKYAYDQLKKDQEGLISSNKYDQAERLEISRRFGRLLSYSPRKINKLLADNTAYRTLDDFNIQATNVFLYYKDLAKATTFYTETLGLELLTEYDNASIIKITDSALLILVDAAKGMHSADEPKTVALALLTNQLPEWYAYLQEKGVEIKYTYKPKEGGPHDGFVAIDPEGYLLEFEMFKQHQENEAFVPYLEQNEEVQTSINYNAKQLSFHGAITWLYYKDLLAMQGFTENVLGLEMVADQGWTKIYRATDTGFIGLVDERRGMHKFTEEKGVTVSFIIEDLDGWYQYVQANEPFELREGAFEEGPGGRYKAFVGFDPEGYFLEFDKFFEHPDNEKLMPLFK